MENLSTGKRWQSSSSTCDPLNKNQHSLYLQLHGHLMVNNIC